MVAQVDEQHAAMVANAMAPSPTGEPSRRYGSRGARRRYGTGSDAWNSQKQMSEGQIGGQEPRRELREGLPEAIRRGNQRQAACFEPEKPAFRARVASEPFAYSAARAYLEAMTVHFPFQNTYAALPANFRPRGADARSPRPG